MAPTAERQALPRAALLVVAAGLIAHCAVLALSYRAVPAAECVRVAAAVIFALVCRTRRPANGVAKVQPLANRKTASRDAVRAILLLSGTLSFVLPWVLIFRGGVVAADVLGPHLFVFAVQLLFEIWSYRPDVIIAVRLTIPVAFVAYRLRLIIEWIEQAQVRQVEPVVELLGIANAVFWLVILFYVLLMRVVPPYFSQLPSQRTTASYVSKNAKLSLITANENIKRGRISHQCTNKKKVYITN